jgi:hypothetical protein
MRGACVHRVVFQVPLSESQWHLAFAVRWAPDWGARHRQRPDVVGSAKEGHQDAVNLPAGIDQVLQQVASLGAHLDAPDKSRAVLGVMEIFDRVAELPEA